MYRHLLLPVDLSNQNQTALDAVASLARPGHTVVTLLHVIEMLQDVPFEEMESFYYELRDKAERTLDGWAGRLSDQGFEVRMEIVFGKRGPEIVSLASEQDVDLIVLRSHLFDRGRPAESFGTLSHQVALLAPCSVLLAR